MRCRGKRLEKRLCKFGDNRAEVSRIRRPCASARGALVLVAAMTGCGSPPSVVPLLEVSERAMRAEARHLAVDGEREAQWIEQTRQSLADAYEQDLAAQSELSAEWVRDATTAYVAAREELVRHQMRRDRQRARRRDNLRAASEALQRAVAMLQGQDALITRVVGGRVWELLELGSGERRSSIVR